MPLIRRTTVFDLAYLTELDPLEVTDGEWELTDDGVLRPTALVDDFARVRLPITALDLPLGLLALSVRFEARATVAPDPGGDVSYNADALGMGSLRFIDDGDGPVAQNLAANPDTSSPFEVDAWYVMRAFGAVVLPNGFSQVDGIDSEPQPVSTMPVPLNVTADVGTAFEVRRAIVVAHYVDL